VEVARCADIAQRLAGAWFAVLGPGNARAGQSDAGLALAACGYADMGRPSMKTFPHVRISDVPSVLFQQAPRRRRLRLERASRHR